MSDEIEKKELRRMRASYQQRQIFAKRHAWNAVNLWESEKKWQKYFTLFNVKCTNISR